MSAGTGDGYRPQVGDLIGLPCHLSTQPYRVLSVADTPVPGRVRIGGYLILDDLSQRHGDFEVPVTQLFRVWDEVWDR